MCKTFQGFMYGISLIFTLFIHALCAKPPSSIVEIFFSNQVNHPSMGGQVTDDDYSTALVKITEAAFMYDRGQAGMLPLDAFEIESMRPEEFKVQIKTVFNLYLSLGELTAMIKLVNKGRGDTEDINCEQFLVFFLRLGFQERTKRLRHHWDDQRIIKEAYDKKKADELGVFARNNSVKKFNALDLEFEPIDKENAMMKLREAAKLYVMQSTGMTF